MFSCQFCEIYKNTFPYRTPLVAASEFCKCIIKVIWKLSTNNFPKVFEIIVAMLIGLSFSLRFLEPRLNTSVTLANLEDIGNFDEPVHCTQGVRIQTFIGPYFPGFNYGKITCRKNPYLNTYSVSNYFVNFKACIFSKIISIFFWYSYMWVWFLHYFMKFWCLQEHYFFINLREVKTWKA